MHLDTTMNEDMMDDESSDILNSIKSGKRILNQLEESMFQMIKNPNLTSEEIFNFLKSLKKAALGIVGDDMCNILIKECKMLLRLYISVTTDKNVWSGVVSFPAENYGYPKSILLFMMIAAYEISMETGGPAAYPVDLERVKEMNVRVRSSAIDKLESAIKSYEE